MRRGIVVLIAFVVLLEGPAAVFAAGQQLDEKIDGPAPPTPPAVAARDATGKVTLRAVLGV